MTYNEIRMKLKAAGVEDYSHDAALLIGHFCGVDRAELLRDVGHDYCSDALIDAVERRAARYPLQYIIGSCSFFREEYKVNENCLIPRNETELLVEKAVSMLPQDACFLDLCTGSGCIAISTLVARRDCTAVAVELYPETIKLAAENAAQNGVSDRLRFVCADICTPEGFLGDEKYDAVLSNPPYVTEDELKALPEELYFEPRAAFDGGADGMYFCSVIIGRYHSYLKKNGFFLIEHGASQRETVAAEAKKHSLLCDCFKDYCGRDRITHIFRSDT